MRVCHVEMLLPDNLGGLILCHCNIYTSIKYGVDLQSLFGLSVQRCTDWLRPRNPLPPHLGSYTRALLVSQDRRHLFVPPCHTRFRCSILRMKQIRIRIWIRIRHNLCGDSIFLCTVHRKCQFGPQCSKTHANFNILNSSY